MGSTNRAHRFTRLSSSNVAFQAHVRDDSRFVLLPVMHPSEISHWVVFDAVSGRLAADGTQFRSFAEAKNWVLTNEET